MAQNPPSDFTAEQKNQRNNLRTPMIVEKIPCEHGLKTFFGYARNISRGGLFISTVKPREPGERFTIELTLPTKQKKTFQCLCEVIWKRHFEKKSPHEPGMGLQFIDLPEEIGNAIDDWVKTFVDNVHPGPVTREREHR